MTSKKINRRDLLFTGGLSLVAATRVFGNGTGAAPPRAQSQTPAQTPISPPTRLLEALKRNRLPLTMSDGPAGRGWDWIVQEARAVRYSRSLPARTRLLA